MRGPPSAWQLLTPAGGESGACTTSPPRRLEAWPLRERPMGAEAGGGAGPGSWAAPPIRGFFFSPGSAGRCLWALRSLGGRGCTPSPPPPGKYLTIWLRRRWPLQACARSPHLRPAPLPRGAANQPACDPRAPQSALLPLQSAARRGWDCGGAPVPESLERAGQARAAAALRSTCRARVGGAPRFLGWTQFLPRERSGVTSFVCH